MHRKTIFIGLFLALVCSAAPTTAQTTAFTYQGKLVNNGSPVTGNYDLQFKLFNALNGGAQQGPTQTVSNVSIANGTFTVELDFGACDSCFNGAPRFLDIGVRPTGGGAFTQLSPRQPITSTPYTTKTANLAFNGAFNDGATIFTASNTLAGEGAGVNTTPNPDLLNMGGKFNSFYGAGAGQANTTGFNNDFFGAAAGQLNTTGNLNAFFGRGAGQGNTTGFNNAFFGGGVGWRNTTGVGNTLIGTGSNFNTTNTTGTINTALGYLSSITANLSNATAIGAFGMVTQSDSLILGAISGVNNCTTFNNCNSVKVGIGTTTPAERLHVVGNGLFDGNLTVNGTLNAALPVGSSNYIQNQNASTQTGDFKISGTGTIGGSLKAPIYYDLNNSGYYLGPAITSRLNGLHFNVVDCINGFCPPNNAIRMTPNLHLNSGQGNAVIVNWDNSTIGANKTFRIGNGQGSDAFYVYADGQVFSTNWFRAVGNTGFLFQDHGGGWYMIDNAWIRSYPEDNNHHVYMVGGFDTQYSAGVGCGGGGVGGSFYMFQVCGAASVGGLDVVSFGELRVGDNGDRFQVKSNGYVSIGSRAFWEKLYVKGTDVVRALVDSDSNAGFALALNSTKKWSLATVTGGNFQIYNESNASNAVWIDSASNNIGIGTTPNDKLEVNGIIRVDSLGSGNTTSLCRNSANQISNCSSSLRYKTNVAALASSLNLINSLRPVTFDWKANKQHDVGLIAEEVSKIEPLLTFRNDKGEIEGVKYDRVTVVLLNAVKEQQAQIERQEHLITRQQQQFNQQQHQIQALKNLICSSHRKAQACK